jgi:hypothetical protein
MFEPTLTRDSPVAFSVDNLAAPGANAAAVVLFAGAAESQHLLGGLAYSYSGEGTLAGGNLQISDGENLVFSLDVSAKGTYAVTFEPPFCGLPGQSLSVTLAAGGSNVTGKLNLIGHATRQRSTGGLLSPDFSLSGNSIYLAVYA